MIFLWIACGLLTIGFTAILVKYILLKKDIIQIERELVEIASTDTNSRICTNTFDTGIVALAESINKMLEINRQTGQEVKRFEADLKRAITNISHDLRTPVTSAKGYLQMAVSGGTDEETLLRYLEIISGRLDSLTVLLDGLFAFSRAIEEDIILRCVNIGNALRDALVADYAEIESKGFVVESHIPDTPVYCICDENALKRVVQNLISNAVIHGNSYLRVGLTDGEIEIANKTDALHRIDVHNIFDRFYTADTSRTNKRTGLGLAIAKELIEKMGGNISASKDNDMIVMRVSLPIVSETKCKLGGIYAKNPV